MKKRRQSKSRIDEGDRQRLEQIVGALNSSTKSGGKLRKLVDLWQKSGPNTSRLFEEHSELERELTEVWKNTSGLFPTNTGAVRLQSLTDIGKVEHLGESAIRTKVDVLFIALLRNSLWGKLAGPCARCEKYYIKKRASQKVYCSRRCGNAATAVARTRERIRNERKDKLDRAKAAMREWKREKPGDDWKSWVSQRTEIDLRFLTRNEPEITKPAKGRSSSGTL